MCVGVGVAPPPPGSHRRALGVPAPRSRRLGSSPFVPPSGQEGWEGGVSRLPPTVTSNASLPDKSQLPRANGLSSCDSVPSGGRVAGVRAAYFPLAVSLRCREQRSLCSWDPFLPP